MTGLLSFILPMMGCFAVLLLVIWWQSRKNSRLQQENQQLQQGVRRYAQELQQVKQRQTIRHQNATASRAELDVRLSKRGDYRD